jgi:uncharacterized protein (DUF2236 family)
MAGDDRPLFPRDAVIRRVNGEGVLLLGGGRAVLMQIAHPLVARGVAEHSDFERDPFGRLVATLNTMTAVVFGNVEQSQRAVGTMQAVHDRVVGDGYSANDPELLQWVYATLIDTALEVHTRFLRPLGTAEAEQFYEQSLTVAEILGVPRPLQPPTLAKFHQYMHHMVDTLTVGDDARRLARSVLRPNVTLALSPVVQPVLFASRQLTAGLLPERLRDGFGLGWDEGRQRALEALQAWSRLTLPLVPSAVRRVLVGG